MQNLKTKISKIQSIIEKNASGTELTAAISTLNELNSYISDRLKSVSAPAHPINGGFDSNRGVSDIAYLDLLEQLHATQEELLKFKMQNETLLQVLHECNSTIERSNSMTTKLLSTVTQKN